MKHLSPQRPVQFYKLVIPLSFKWDKLLLRGPILICTRYLHQNNTHNPIFTDGWLYAWTSVASAELWQDFRVTGKSVLGVIFPLSHHLMHHMSHFPGTERWRGKSHAGLCISCHLKKKKCCIIWLLPNPITSPLGWSPAPYSLITSLLQWPWSILDSDHFLFSKPILHKISLTFWSHSGKKCTQPFVRADLTKTSHWFRFCSLFPIYKKVTKSEGMTVNFFPKQCFPLHIYNSPFPEAVRV